jgi:NAD(P)-dependent dehydrogenase (short-subunit alcohol dehydrogenase family)
MTDSRVILVTGSSRGIGAGLVSGFANKGFRTVINYSKSGEEAATLQKQVAKIAGRDNVLLIKADVSNRSEVRGMFNEIIRTFGRVDALINNAGLNKDGPFLEMGILIIFV